MNLFEDGIQYFKDKNYQEALKCFRQALDENQRVEDCRNKMGEIYESILKYDLAFEMYNRNIKNKNDAESYFRITNLLMNQNKLEQATFFINQGTQLHPHNASLLYVKGLLLQSKYKQHQEAVINFDKCLQKDPTYKEAILKKIDSLFELKEYHQIIDSYNKYLKMSNNNIEVYKKIGNIQILLFQYKNAIENYLQCIQLDQNFTEAYHNLGSVYQIVHQYDSAIQIFDQCISAMLRIAKNSALSQDFNNKGFTKKKRKILIAQRRKTQEQILNNLVVQKKYDELLLFLSKLLQPWKDLILNSQEYVQQRKMSIAQKILNNNTPVVNRFSPRFEQIMYFQLSKAKCLKELGRYEESLTELKVCEKSEQHLDECALLRSKLLLLSKLQGYKEETENNNEERNLNEEVKKDQTNDKEQQNNDWQTEQRKEAIKLLREVLERDPTNSKALLQLGEIYDIEKEIPKQIQIYSFILENQPYNEEAINKLINISKKGFTIDNIRELKGKLNFLKHSQYEDFIYACLQADQFMEQTEITNSVARLINEGIQFYHQNKYQVENSTSFLKLFFYFGKQYDLSVKYYNMFNDSTSPQSMLVFAKALFRSNNYIKALEIINFLQKQYCVLLPTQQESQENIPNQITNIQNQTTAIGSKLNLLNTQSYINNNFPQQQNNNNQKSEQNLLSKIEVSKAHSSSISSSSSNQGLILMNSQSMSFKNQFSKMQHLFLLVQGQCFERLQMYEKALVCYSDAIIVQPKFYLIYFHRGQLYYKMGLLGDALKNVEKAILFNQFHTNSLLLMAKIFQKQQKKSEYLSTLQKGLKLLSNSISLTHIGDEDDAEFLLADSGRADELNDESLNYAFNNNNVEDYDEEDEQEFDYFIQQKIKKLQKSNMTSASINERAPSHLIEGISSFEENFIEESKFHLETALTEVIVQEQKSLTYNPILLLCQNQDQISQTRFAAHYYLNQAYLKNIYKNKSQKQQASEKITTNDKQLKNKMDSLDSALDNNLYKLGFLINKALLYFSFNQYNLGIDIFFDELFPEYAISEASTYEQAEAVIYTGATHLIYPLFSLGLNEKLIKLCEYISEFKKKVKKKEVSIPQHIQEKLPSTEYLILISIANYRQAKYEESINCLQLLIQTHLDPIQLQNSSSNKFVQRWNEYSKITHFFLSLNFFQLNNIPSCLNHLQLYLRETPENYKQITNNNANNNNNLFKTDNKLNQKQLSSSTEIIIQHLQSDCSYVLMVDLLLQNKLSSEVPPLCEAILESLYDQIMQYSLPTILQIPRQGYFTRCQNYLTKNLKNLTIQKIKPQFEGSLRIFFPLINEENADFIGKVFDFYEYSYFDRQSNLNSHLLVKLEGGIISQIMNPIQGKKIILAEQRCEANKIRNQQQQREMIYRLILTHKSILKVHFFLKQGRDIYAIQDESYPNSNASNLSSKNSFSNLQNFSQIKQLIIYYNNYLYFFINQLLKKEGRAEFNGCEIQIQNSQLQKQKSKNFFSKHKTKPSKQP